MMKKLLITFTIGINTALLIFACLNAAAYAETPDPSYSNNQAVWIFYNQLLPYGSWINHSEYGWVWQPAQVSSSWQPYTKGHWAFTDYGWTWVSDDPWGWAVFHYGRWFKDTYYGWLWYPGSEWAPAWVVWRYNDDLIGWAPLPPGISGSSEFDFDFTYTRFDDLIPAPNYTFIEIRYFTQVNIISHIIVHRDKKDLFSRTRVYADYRQRYNGYRRNSLPMQERISRDSGHSIAPARTIEIDPPVSTRRYSVKKGEITIVRPKFDTVQRNREREIVIRDSQEQEKKHVRKDTAMQQEKTRAQSPNQPQRLIQQPPTIIVPQKQKEEIRDRSEIKPEQTKIIKPERKDEPKSFRKENKQGSEVLEQDNAAKNVKSQDRTRRNTNKEGKAFQGNYRERENFRKTNDLIRQPRGSIGVGIHNP